LHRRHTNLADIGCKEVAFGTESDGYTWAMELSHDSPFETVEAKVSATLRLLSVFLGRGVIPYEQGGGQVHKPSLDLSTYQVVRTGDLVLNNQQAWRGSVGVSHYDGIISPAYVVLELDETINRSFADYLFQSRLMVDQFVTSSKGVGDIQRDISMPWLRNVKVPLSSPPTQLKIAERLDKELCNLNRQVQMSIREVELVQEYRTRLITDVVTGKVDVRHLPSAAILPSPADLELLDKGEAIDDELAEEEELEAVEEVTDAD